MQLGADGLGKMVSFDRLSSATKKKKLPTNGDDEDNTTKVTDNKMTKLDTSEASQNIAIEYVVDK